VIVIAERDADVGRAFADLREHAAQALPVIGGGLAVFWLLVGDLQVQSPDVVHESRVARVLVHYSRLDRRIDLYVAARERRHREPLLVQQPAEGGWSIAEFLEDVRSNLDALEPK